MKPKSRLFSSSVIIMALLLLPALTVSAGPQTQGGETAWVVWETGSPVQRLAWDGSALWAGAYKGGLSQWQLEAGQVAGYTTADGLSGNHVTSIAVDGSGQKWLALLDGSLNRTEDGSGFTNVTPAGAAGQNAWDLFANGDDIWLASLGGGVSRYSGGAWTTYNTSNSTLPHNDIYAVAVDAGGTPWAGTVNYGVAAFQGGDWVPYTLPVQIASPASPGAFVSNQAVTDIAVDSSGNKWFATDGSGVAMLDASNANWTVYDTSNSGLDSNFIQSIHIDAQGNLWFGTLSGGVSRLSADHSTWLTYDVSNSALPEDDILNVATDSQGGLWLAAYDSGLAYYGDLPASPPTFELDLFQKPDYQPGKVKGYYLWVDPATYEWTLAWSGDGKDHSFTGEILADADLTYLSDAGLEAGDAVVVNGSSLTVSANEASGEDSVTFKPSLAVTELTVRLMIDGAYYPYNIHVGALGAAPGTAPFTVAAVQPVPPVVTVPDSMIVDEGDYVLLTGEVSDPDSPTGHTIVWNLGDGTLVEDELTVDHIYPDDGSFTAQLTVTDIHERVGTDLLNITVQNVTPDVDFYYYPFTPNSQQEVTFTGYFYDPGTLDTHTIVWNFGDGSAPLTTSDLTVTHIYEHAGTFTVALTITDDDGGIGVAVFNVEVLNDPPQFELGDDITIDEGGQFTRSVAFTDPDSTEWDLVVDYGDGTEPVSSELNAEGNFDLDHVYVDNGAYVLEVFITDDAEAVVSDTITVTVQNMAPLVNAGIDQTVEVGSIASIDAFYTDVGISDTHSAMIDWGDGNQEPVPTVVTGPGAGQVTGQHIYASAGDFSVEICVTDSDAGTGCDSMVVHIVNGPTATPTFTPTPTGSSDFPTTNVLDNFNRVDGAIGNDWGGNSYAYLISSNQMLVDSGGSNSDIYWSAEAFGPDQEVYVTFSQVNANAGEQDLLLKVQNNNNWGDGVLEVLYDSTNQRVQVWTYEWPQEWIQYGADIPVTFSDGDQFGARARADGTVEVYRNGELLATRDITSWSHYADGGYLGLWIIDGEGAILDDFGGGNVSAGATPTASLTPTVTATPSFTPTPTSSQTPAPGGGTTEVHIGETYITSVDDYGNANLMVAQHTTLSQEATIQSLSFYVTQAAGNLRLGIYDDANGNPGSLVAKTDEFVPVVGWNTQSVQTPVLLPPGSYWLAYLPESNDLHSRFGWPGEGQETGRYYSYTYSEMPVTFSSSAWSGEFQSSFYATFTVAVEPGTIFAGEVNVLHADVNEAGNLLIAQETQLTHNAVVQSLSFYVANAAGNLRLGIYDNDSDGPGTLMAQTDEFTPVAGWNTVSVQTPVLLPSGTYWLAFLPESDNLGFKYEWIQGQYTGRVYGYSFGAMPSMVTGQPIGVEYRFSFYATFIEDDSVYTPTTMILDDFNRADGAIGSNWTGSTSMFEISSNKLEANTGAHDSYIFWENESFGPDQEAYVTISQVDTDMWYLSLLLKSQSNTTYEDGFIEVYYQANINVLQVWSLDPVSGWTQHGGNVPVELGNGDQLAARTFADGRLEIYKNDVLVASRNLASWAYSGDGGSIGLWFENAAGQRLDDFGGGTISGGEMMASTFRTLEAGIQPEGSIEFSVVSSQFNPATDLDADFLQSASTASGQKAYVTLPVKETDKVLLDRSQREKSQQDGDVRVLFDISGKRIQLLTYDSQKGWVQFGKDISVRFKDGDRFRLSVNEMGILVIYRNEKILIEKELSSLSQQVVDVVSRREQVAAIALLSSQPIPASSNSTTIQNLSYNLPKVFAALLPILTENEIEEIPLPGLTLQQPTMLIIDYIYDALNRHTSATYSDGRRASPMPSTRHGGDDLHLQRGQRAGNCLARFSHDRFHQRKTMKGHQ